MLCWCHTWMGGAVLGLAWDGVMLEAIVTPSTLQLTPHSSSRRTGFSVPDKEGCGLMLMMNEDIIHGTWCCFNGQHNG